MAPAIDVRGLRKSFGGTAVLAELDLSVERGTVFALLGPNGAGKTTLINILSTLVLPDGGTAMVDSHDVVREPLAVRRSIGLTGQSAAVDGVLTGSENLRMMGRLSGLGTREARARERYLLERFGLADVARKRVATYSGGMRRRLDLALSLVVTPPVLFLDEPTTGLDTRSRLELWEVIRSLRDEGTTVFLTTQYLEEADQLADQIAVLNRGAIVAQGTPDELKRRTGGEVVELRDEADNLLKEIPTDGSLSGLRRAIDELDSSFADGVVTLRKPSLDDVFLALTESDEKELVRS
ncbi:MAG: transporter ATP-binding protein [Rhodoglobus sp.]|nr:transporter ATP-binding protein [Rhodoglobus sp.]